MGSSRTSITMIELLAWIIFPLPMIIIAMVYLLTKSKPKRIIQVWSSDNNKVDEHGGPYEVEIEDN